jgi:hypothetical protein
MKQREDIYEWMAKQKFPLSKSKVNKVSVAKLAELREVGIKFVGVLGSNSPDDCEACQAIAFTPEKDGTPIDIEFATPLPLPGCNKRYCKCIYIALKDDGSSP